MIISPDQFSKIIKWKPSKRIAYVLVLVVLSLYGYSLINKVEIKSSTSKDNSQQNINMIGTLASPEILGEVGIKSVREGTVEKGFNKDDWEINKRFEFEKDIKDPSASYYCVKNSKDFDSAIMWYDEKISLGTTLKLRYALKNKDNFDKNTPKLIFAFGDDSQFRIFLPEDTKNEFIGIERTDSEGKKSRDHKRLIGKIDSFRESLFEITINSINANKASFIYNLSFFPITDGSEEDKNEDRQISDENTFDEFLPWPDPWNTGFRQKVGIGVFNNTCIRIISATLCGGSESL